MNADINQMNQEHFTPKMWPTRSGGWSAIQNR